MTSDIVTLFRPVGSSELKLIEESGFRRFPPRLPEQPIFYPVTNEAYAAQIARDWNTKTTSDGMGYVTQFDVERSYLDRFERQIVGGRAQEEYWIPAESLEEFNDRIVGEIAVIATFSAKQQETNNA